MNEEIEYCYDKEGNRYEVGPSFKDGPTGGGVLSSPICRACIHQKIEDYELYCEVLNPVPEDVDKGKIYKCVFYKADKNSIDYYLVQELMKRGKMLDKPWDYDKQMERE